MTRHHSCRVSPFGHPRINARLTAPRGLSQPPTSFIGSQCQGIHHAPLNTYNTKPNKQEKLHHNNPHTPPTRNPKAHTDNTCDLMLATTIHKSNTTPHHQDGATTTTPQPPGQTPTIRRPAPPHPQQPGMGAAEPVASGPNSVSGDTGNKAPLPAGRKSETENSANCLSCTHQAPTTGNPAEISQPP